MKVQPSVKRICEHCRVILSWKGRVSYYLFEPEAQAEAR